MLSRSASAISIFWDFLTIYLLSHFHKQFVGNMNLHPALATGKIGYRWSPARRRHSLASACPLVTSQGAAPGEEERVMAERRRRGRGGGHARTTSRTAERTTTATRAVTARRRRRGRGGGHLQDGRDGRDDNHAGRPRVHDL
jgi:hypothetical protein